MPHIDASIHPTETLSLRDKVKRKLVADVFAHKYDLQVEESDGCVQIFGKVRLYYDKQLAQRVVMTIPEVKELDNQLEVR